MRKLFLAGPVALLLACVRPLPLPLPVALVSPADGAKTSASPVKFVWEYASDAVKYELQLAEDAKFKKMTVSDTLDTTEVELAVQTDGAYYWRVRIQNSSEVWSEWSSARSVTLERFELVANVPTQGYAQGIWVGGNLALIADDQAGLAAFDVSNPEAPVAVGRVMDSLNKAYSVVSDGHYAYVAYGYKELMVVDVSKPESLKRTGELEYPQPGFGYDVALADTFAYIAADAQFIIVNVKQAQYPNLVFQYRYPYGCRGVAVKDSFCYLALEQLGVAVWNVARLPAVELGGMDTRSNARGCAAAGDFLYVADGREGLTIADISDPAHPELVAGLALDGYANRVSLADTLAYVGCSDGGVAIVNVKDPVHPLLVAQVRCGYTRQAVESNGYVFGCDRDLGLVVIKKK